MLGFLLNPMISWRGFVLGAIAWLTLPAPVAARLPPDGSISVPSLTVPSDRNVVVGVELSSDVPLTVLAFDVRFEPAEVLCAALADPRAILVRSVGRTIPPAEKDSIQCEDGRVRVVLFTLVGATVIPPGAGPIVEIDFGAVKNAIAVPIEMRIAKIEANSGPIQATIANHTAATVCRQMCDRDPDAVEGFVCSWGCGCLPDDSCEPATLTIATPDEPTPTAPPATEVGDVHPPSDLLPAPVVATDPSVSDRLRGLIAVADQAGACGKLLHPLHRAESRLTRVEQLRQAGAAAKARAMLRQATRALGVFRRRLRSPRMARLLGKPATAGMLAVVDPLRIDLQALATAPH